MRHGWQDHVVKSWKINYLLVARQYERLCFRDWVARLCLRREAPPRMPHPGWLWAGSAEWRWTRALSRRVEPLSNSAHAFSYVHGFFAICIHPDTHPGLFTENTYYKLGRRCSAMRLRFAMCALRYIARYAMRHDVAVTCSNADPDGSHVFSNKHGSYVIYGKKVDTFIQKYKSEFCKR